MPKLCHAFVRIESPLKAKVPGTGLGLYLTKRLLAEVLKGEIICTSSYGEGSRFTIKVPVKIE
jgi:signal transduction histidine kinase